MNDEERRKHLRAPIGPFKCGGARGCGALYGVYWPTRLKKLATFDSLSEQEACELEASLSEFETDFRKLDGIDPVLSTVICRLFVNTALIGSYAGADGREQLRRELATQRASERARRASGGKTQAKKLNAQKHERYGRADVVAEMESIGRGNPDIKQPGAVKHLRDALNPRCHDRTLRRIYTGWKEDNG